MPSAYLIKALLEHATVEGSRSTALKPIGWMTGVLASATLGAFYLRVPAWVGMTFCVSTGLSVLLYLIAYVYFMIKDRDALRSEKYSLQKLAMEKGFIGDDIYGLLEPGEETALPLLVTGSSDESEVPDEG